mgnify:CR=1 FL=1
MLAMLLLVSRNVFALVGGWYDFYFYDEDLAAPVDSPVVSLNPFA